MILSKFFEINWWKTLVFNLHYFSLRQAALLPVLVYRNTELADLGGRLVIEAPLRRAMVRLGARSLGTRNAAQTSTIWECRGTVVLGGPASLGQGTKISVEQGGTLSLGAGFCITGDSTLICKKRLNSEPAACFRGIYW